MTNKQERYYVVSESELEEYKYAVADAALCLLDSYDRASDGLLKASTACRARPVPEEATHFYWETEERNGLGVPVAQTEEIRK